MDKMTKDIIITQRRCFGQMYDLFDATSRFCLEKASNDEARNEMLKLIIVARQIKTQMDTLAECVEEAGL